VIAAAVLGFVVAASFWLAYFDFFTIRAERLLADRSGAPRTALARDTYTYLHLPMIGGIVLFAFAMKKTLAHIGDELPTVPAVVLCCGPALYLLAYVGVRARVSHHLGGGRLVASIACVALVPVAVVVPAIVALSLLATVWVALHAYELIWWREERAATRTPSRSYSAPDEGRDLGSEQLDRVHDVAMLDGANADVREVPLRPEELVDPDDLLGHLFR
jgi:low temperature requirement protein LtrA